jgi:hypothetical protein
MPLRAWIASDDATSLGSADTVLFDHHLDEDIEAAADEEAEAARMQKASTEQARVRTVS